jgi:hypothetical protein
MIDNQFMHLEIINKRTFSPRLVIMDNETQRYFDLSAAIKDHGTDHQRIALLGMEYFDASKGEEISEIISRYLK